MIPRSRGAIPITVALLVVGCLLLSTIPMSTRAAEITDCYAIADEHILPDGTKDGADTLVRMDFTTGQTTIIGLTGTRNIETMTFGPLGVLFAVDEDQVGTVNLTTGVFTPLSLPIGVATGSVNHLIRDVDAIAYSPFSGLTWAAERREPGNDFLFAVDSTMGYAIANTLREIPSITDEDGNALANVDDFSVDPVTGVFYAAINMDNAIGGTLATIDVATGTATRISTFRYPVPYPANPALAGTVIDDIEGLSFYNDGKLYASAGNNGPDDNDKNQLFQIDLATGTGISLGAFPPEVRDVEALGCLTRDLPPLQTPTPTNTFTSTPTSTSTATPTPTGTLTPTPTGTLTATPTATATDTPTPTATDTPTPTPTLKTPTALEPGKQPVIGPGPERAWKYKVNLPSINTR